GECQRFLLLLLVRFSLSFLSAVGYQFVESIGFTHLLAFPFLSVHTVHRGQITVCTNVLCPAQLLRESILSCHLLGSNSLCIRDSKPRSLLRDASDIAAQKASPIVRASA